MNCRVSWHWWRYEPASINSWSFLLGPSYFALGASRSLMLHLVVGFLSVQWTLSPDVA